MPGFKTAEINFMIKKYPPIALFIIILTTPALLNAAPIIKGNRDLLTALNYSSGRSLQGRVEMDGVTGINTPANEGVSLFSFNSFGETILRFETENLISLVDAVYTWDGGGFITQSGALGPPNSTGARDFIVPDITFLTGHWTGPVTGQIEEDSGSLIINGSGTDIKDQTLLDFYGIEAADNSWQFSFEAFLRLDHMFFHADGSFGISNDTSVVESITFDNINTAAQVPAPTTLILFMTGLITLGFYNFRRKRSNWHRPFDGGIAWV